MDCRLCKEIEDFENSLFAQRYPGLVNRNVFFETDGIQVMLPIGPFCEGHVLVVAKNHAWSFAHILEEVRLELVSVVERVGALLGARYGRLLLFEHGPMSRARLGGCCLEHAHMNMMPVPASLNVRKAAARFVRFFPSELRELGGFVERGEAYLFFKCAREGSFAGAAPEGCSQFFRQLVAREAGGRPWDWRANPRTEAQKGTLAVLREGL